MEYSDWKLEFIKIVCEDIVSDEIKVQEILAILKGAYGDEHLEGFTSQEAWDDEKSYFEYEAE